MSSYRGIPFVGLSRRVKPRPIVTCDIETWGLDARPEGFALGVVTEPGSAATASGHAREGDSVRPSINVGSPTTGSTVSHPPPVIAAEPKSTGFSNLEDMRNYLLRPAFAGHTVYAHNGGKYDYLAIFGNFWTFFGPDNVTMNDSRFIQATYRSRETERGKERGSTHVIYFRDSLNIIPAALSKIGERFGYPKGKTPAKFIKKGEIINEGTPDEYRGEYDGHPVPIEREDWEYCKRDTVLLWKALSYFQDRLGPLRPTLPSTAMAVFRREFFPAAGPIYICRREDLLFRDAYYGGRVEAYRMGKLPLPNYTYDVNSLYPFAMSRSAFPDPAGLQQRSDVSPDELRDDLLRAYEGFASCTVRHPDLDYGLLPHVSVDDKLTFPIGTFEGSWCFPEIRYFLERGGVVESVSRVVYGPRLPSPFLGYVTKYYALKQGSDGFEREMAKLMLNALYGKFGEYHEQNQRYATGFDEATLETYRKTYGDANFEPVSRERSDGYYVFPSRDAGIAGHSVFSWAAYVTSEARVINAQIQAALRQEGQVFYTDTDSFTVTCEIGTDLPPERVPWPVGDAMGALRLETRDKLEIRGNKHYVLADGSVVLKGVRRGAKFINGKYQWDSVVGIKEAIRRGIVPGSPQVRARFPVAAYDKRVCLPDGSTLPIRLMGNEIGPNQVDIEYERKVRKSQKFFMWEARRKQGAGAGFGRVEMPLTQFLQAGGERNR